MHTIEIPLPILFCSKSTIRCIPHVCCGFLSIPVSLQPGLFPTSDTQLDEQSRPGAWRNPGCIAKSEFVLKLSSLGASHSSLDYWSSCLLHMMNQARCFHLNPIFLSPPFYDIEKTTSIATRFFKSPIIPDCQQSVRRREIKGWVFRT